MKKRKVLEKNQLEVYPDSSWITIFISKCKNRGRLLGYNAVVLVEIEKLTTLVEWYYFHP